MNDQLEIRSERLSDAQRIHDITREAFREAPYAAGTEQHIIDALRSAGALTLSLVATLDGVIVGHVGFSPLATSWKAPGWFGLGPVSVLPTYQKRGVGSALITEGLRRLKTMGAEGCALAGDPEYYSRFGFSGDSHLEIERVPPSASLYLRFRDSNAAGALAFHEAFFRTYAPAPT